MADYIHLADDYMYDDFRIAGIESTVIDASDAHWIVSNLGDRLNLYPVVVSDSAGVTLIGGTIDGQVPVDISWEDAYVNSAAIFVRGTQGAVIRDWTITQVWHGIRIRGIRRLHHRERLGHQDPRRRDRERRRGERHGSRQPLRPRLRGG